MENTTAVIKKLNNRLNELDKGSLRYQVLETALLFKTNWINLGEKLYQVYKTEEYKKWGYRTFDTYCTQEIGIRKKTAEKLTTSYYFLQEHEPKILAESQRQEVPDYKTISFLADIHSDKNVPEEKYEELKQAAFEEGCTDRILKQRYNNFLKEIDAQSGEHDELDKDDNVSKKEISGLIQAFERIDRKVEELSGIPVEIKTDIRKILAQLKTLI